MSDWPLVSQASFRCLPPAPLGGRGCVDGALGSQLRPEHFLSFCRAVKWKAAEGGPLRASARHSGTLDPQSAARAESFSRPVTVYVTVFLFHVGFFFIFCCFFPLPLPGCGVSHPPRVLSQLLSVPSHRLALSGLLSFYSLLHTDASGQHFSETLQPAAHTFNPSTFRVIPSL